jgi:hypothetical protein
VLALALALSVGIGAVWRCRSCADRRRTSATPIRGSWPVLVVGRGADATEANDALTRAGVAWEPPSSDDERAAALALGTLAPPELEALRAALDDLETRLQARSNPMVEDLEDGDPLAPLALLLRRFLPALTACDAIASRRRATPEGTMVVAVAMTCEAPDGGATCLPLWNPSPGGRSPEERSVERARFLEWPLATAAVLGFANVAEAGSARANLRAGSREAASRIALVLDEADLRGGEDGGVAEVRRIATRVLTLASHDRAVDTTVLELIAREPPPGSRRVPWLRLDAEEILVVPRLGALANLASFVDEIERHLGGAGLAASTEWVRRPETIR